MASPNLENLSIHDIEEEGFTFDIEEKGDEQVDLKWCLECKLKTFLYFMRTFGSKSTICR
jgi:hypothetical protein